MVAGTFPLIILSNVTSLFCSLDSFFSSEQSIFILNRFNPAISNVCGAILTEMVSENLGDFILTFGKIKGTF